MLSEHELFKLIWQKKNVVITNHETIFYCDTNHYEIITLVFSVTWSFRNHSNADFKTFNYY